MRDIKRITVGGITIGGALAFILGLISLTANLQQLGWLPRKPEHMTGDFRIAVAGFATTGARSSFGLGNDLAKSVEMRLQTELSEARPNFTVTIWGPERVGKIRGYSAEERGNSAARIGDSLEADMVVYGTVGIQDSLSYVLPEFYLSTNRFYEAGEITGNHEFGMQIPIPSQGSVADRIEVGSELAYRAKILSHVAVGLSYYSGRDYRKALDYFRVAELGLRPQDESVRQLLLLLAGNAATRGGDLELAEEDYEGALRVDPQYARAFLGLGDVYYLKAQGYFEQTQNPDDIDTEMIDVAVSFYRKAAGAANQPILADVSTKVHFGLGQARLMQVYSGREDSFDEVVEEFEAVIREYDKSGNPRLRRLAAESHARLGLIFELSGDRSQAAAEYRVAASLLGDDPERQAHYADRAQRIENGETQ